MLCNQNSGDGDYLHDAGAPIPLEGWDPNGSSMAVASAAAAAATSNWNSAAVHNNISNTAANSHATTSMTTTTTAAAMVPPYLFASGTPVRGGMVATRLQSVVSPAVAAAAAATLSSPLQPSFLPLQLLPFAPPSMSTLIPMQHQQQPPLPVSLMSQSPLRPSFVTNGGGIPVPMRHPAIHAMGQALPQQQHNHHRVAPPRGAPLPSPHHPQSQQQQQQQQPPLRSGKWIPEEEEYADLLVTLFEQGLLSDCDNGSTLRSYLSQKLQCAPMRISKKFAGKGIGKMVYMGGVDDGSNTTTNVNSKQAELMLQRTKKAEITFLHTVRPSASALVTPQPQVPLGVTNNAMIIPAMVVPIIAVPSGPPMIPMAAPTVASSSSSVPALRTTAAASSLTVQQRTQQLHESYRRALQQQAEELQQKNGVKPLTTTDAASALSRSPIPQMAPTTPLSSSPPATSVTPTKATIKSTPSPKQTPPPTPKTSAARPDFLSGFEKVVPPAKRGKMSTAALTSSDQPNSLPLRNRLMEDFHRLLEKKDNVTLVNVAVTTTSGNDALTADTDNIVYDTTALFTAESYAMFAQQSAMEASRHGAYAFQLNSFPLVSTKRLPSAKTLDLDDVLQRIADDAIKAPSSSAKASPDHWPNQAQESHSPENKSHVAAETGLGNKKRQMTKSMVATPSSPPPININKNNKTSGLTPVERFVGAATTKHLVSEPSGSSRSAHSHHHNTNSDETTSNSSSSDDTTGATSNDEGQSSSEGEGEAKRTKFDSSSSAQVPRRTRLEYRN